MACTLEEVAYRLLPRVAAGRALADREWRTLVRVADTLLSGASTQLPPERVADNVERFLSTGRSKRTWRVRILLTLVEYSPLLHVRRCFSDLEPAERRAYVEAHWIGGVGLGALCARIRLLVLMGSYGDTRSWDRIGFVPVPLRLRFQRGHGRAARRSGLDAPRSAMP
jgi:hypothetical protein